MKKSLLVCLLSVFALTAVAQNTTFTTTVTSSSPSSGVPITTDRADNGGLNGGNTGSLVLTYNSGSFVKLTAPSYFNGTPFNSWTGCYYTSGLLCLVNVTRNSTVTVNYGGASAGQVKPGVVYQFPAITATGPAVPFLNFTSTNPPIVYPPVTSTIDWFTTGTAPTVCTAEVDGSSNGTTWYPIATGITCTATGSIQVVKGPVLMMRVNVLTFTGVAGTSVTFAYTNGGGVSQRP